MTELASGGIPEFATPSYNPKWLVCPKCGFQMVNAETNMCEYKKCDSYWKVVPEYGGIMR